MPYAIHQAGLFAGLALMTLVAGITDYSLIIMVRAGHLAGSFTYQVCLINKFFNFYRICTCLELGCYVMLPKLSPIFLTRE